MLSERIVTTDEIWQRVCSRAEEAGMIPAELAGLLLTYAVGALDGNQRTSEERTSASADDGDLPPRHDG